ncbi:MAG TPA: hypothetical protein EYQ25_08260 [Planctomycetes bacterium]|nr:hypothetical protein [Planctomycetota bacterium]HIL38374.1 hypothetical protein [Planctomycetota bacterium]
MARSCGIRIGPERFEIVVLDGSSKRHRIVGWAADEFVSGLDEEGDSLTARAKQLEAAFEEVKGPKDNVHLVVNTGMAAFRRLTVPFSDRAKIEQVLKFEVESDLPQWSIDDVVVDSHVLTSSENEADLLAVALQKSDLSSPLELCKSAGFEPLEAEIEATAVFNAAMSAGLCNIDDSQLLVHVGDTATAVVVVDSGELRDMRVIHIGAHAGQPAGVASKDEGTEDQADEEGLEVGQAEASQDYEVSRSQEQAVKRIVRELGRTLSAARTINEISAIYVCGVELPGLVGGSVQDVPIFVLDCFDEDSGQPADGFGPLVAAYGGALVGLDVATIAASLRREELKFTGTWERLEFPLAIATMLIATLLGVINIFQHRELSTLEIAGARWYIQSTASHVFGDLKKAKRGYLYPVPTAKESPFLAGFKARFDAKEPVWEGDEYNALDQLVLELQKENLKMEKRLGTHTDFPQPQSAFVAATLVFSVLDANSDKWRPSLRRVDALYQPGRNKNQPETVRVTMDLVFFAEDTVEASRDYEGFLSELKRQSWLHAVEERSSKDLDDGKGVLVEALPITVNVETWLKNDGLKVNGGDQQ